MNARTIAAVLIVSVAIIVVVIASDDASAVEEPQYTHYCYGENAHLVYPYNDGAQITWTVEKYDDSGQMIDTDSSLTGRSIDVSLTGLNHIVVTQVATIEGIQDTETVVIKAMHVRDSPNGCYTVRFIDRDTEYYTDTIDENRMVESGKPFVLMPPEPSAQGMTFLGWYYLNENNEEMRFNEYDVLTSDYTLYAKWVNNGSGSHGGQGGTGTVDVDSHVVTFQTEPGMYYTVMGKGQGFVSFTVSVIDGFRYEDISVTSDSGTVTYQNGAYILSGITRDTVVTVTGERMYTVEYHMPDGVSVSAHGYGENPGLVSAGPLVMVVSGPSDMVITVLMGSEDVTDRCVSGDTVSIGDVTGNLFVLVVSTSAAQDSGDGFPWWLVALAIVLIAVVAIVYMYLRFRS